MSSSKSLNRNSPRSGNPSALSTAPLSAASPSRRSTSLASLHPSGHVTRKHRSFPNRRANSSASACPGASASTAMTMRDTGSSAARQFHRYSNLRSSSGAGTGPSLTFPGAVRNRDDVLDPRLFQREFIHLLHDDNLSRAARVVETEHDLLRAFHLPEGFILAAVFDVDELAVAKSETPARPRASPPREKHALRRESVSFRRFERDAARP